MDIKDICINCFQSTGGEEVCMHCGYIQTDKPKQICHLYPRTILNNRYIIGRVINNGGFGVVYKAYDMRLETVVAIKELLPTQNSMVTRMPPSLEVIPVNDERREAFIKLKQRFMKEARVMAQFSECNSIVRIYDFFEANNTAYLVMEFLEGMTLRQYIDTIENQMSFESALNTIMPIMQALKVIHSGGVIHKDVSPDNIFICDDGTVKLIDFGAAQFEDDVVDEDTFGSVVMKLGYTPPEQYRANSEVTPCSDIYSIGAVFYAVLTGQIPPESIDRIENDTLQRLSKQGIDLPLYADKAIMKAMALKEHNRFSSMQDFIDAITGKKKADFPEIEIRKKKIRNACIVSVIVVAMIGSVFAAYMVKSMNSIVPKKNTTITLWYVDSGDEEMNARWEKAAQDFKKFAKSQKDTLDNTNVKAVGIPEDQYESKLKKAFENGKAPDIYQSTSSTFDEHAISLNPLIKRVEKGETALAYDVMLDEFQEHNKLAVCFDMPVLYTYTDNSKNKVPKKSTSLEELVDAKKLSGFSYSLICNPNAVMNASYAYGAGKLDGDTAQMLFDSSKTFSDGKYIKPQKLFVKNSNNAMYYVGMMSEYSDILEKSRMGSASFSVSRLTGDGVKDTYVFPELWCISDSTSIVNRNTSNLFLYFLLCNYEGQRDMIRVGSDTHYLPMLTSTTDSIGYYDKYEFIYNNNDIKNVKTIPYDELDDVDKKTKQIIEKSKNKKSNYNDIS